MKLVLPTPPDPWVGRRSLASASAEMCKISWAWVLERWGERTHSSAPEWYHERRAVTHVSQQPAQRGASSVGLGSWSAFSRPSAPEWYQERRGVTDVSQDPSPGPHSVSFFHFRPSLCSEFLKKVNSRCKKSKFCLDPQGKGLASGAGTRYC